MTILLADDEISKLEKQRRIVRCVAVVCRVCGFRQHAKPDTYLPDHERCPNGCVTYFPKGQCRLCGDPAEGTKAACSNHHYTKYREQGDGTYTTHIVETHWHAAEGAGPVSQYAVTS